MAEIKEQKNKVSEIRVSLHGLHLAPRKVRLIVGSLQNLPVYHAQDQLRFMVQKGARPLAKLVASGVSAARNDHQIEPERLYVKSLTVDGGRVAKRYKPRAQGRAFPIRRRTSRLSLVLGVSDKPLSERREQEPKKKPVRAAQRPALDPKPRSRRPGKETAESQEKKAPAETRKDEPPKEKKSWFRLFGKKSKSEEVPAKKDVKGKRQKQTFDRRGNM